MTKGNSSSGFEGLHCRPRRASRQKRRCDACGFPAQRARPASSPSILDSWSPHIARTGSEGGRDSSPNMLDTISSQYDSFIYWRMPIPRLDVAELEGLGLSDVALYKPKGGLGKLASERDQVSQDISDEEDGLLQFNSFNFWRAPIASISSLDFDLI
ncbi:PREDICTED: protein AF1q isoform X2 [Aptenodytes forsteri]|uniref:protein AF1q isoform X2 n=1 Tax=Aptenodytes forsteri TaxID=9233 RepID=UPI0004F439C9|nr:PREDICTED: protein AF1q isoform X2 [Aptenodytes forsteri]